PAWIRRAKSSVVSTRHTWLSRAGTSAGGTPSAVPGPANTGRGEGFPVAGAVAGAGTDGTDPAEPAEPAEPTEPAAGADPAEERELPASPEPVDRTEVIGPGVAGVSTGTAAG